MNITELQTLLHEQADTVADQGVTERGSQLQHRIAAARRRRAAGAVGVTAAAVVAAAGLVLSPVELRGDGPVDNPDRPAELAGHTVPATQVAEGFTYEYVRGIESSPGSKELRAQVEVEDEPVVVAFASSEPDSFLHLTVDRGSQESASSASGRFSSFALLKGPGKRTLELTQEDGLGQGRLALAVYELSDDAPEGVGNGTVAFLQEEPGYRLISAGISEPGQLELEVPMILPDGPVAFGDFCYGAPAGTEYRFKVPGWKGYMGSDCSVDLPNDPRIAGRSQTVGEDPAMRQAAIEARMWVILPEGVTSAPDLVMGFAAYRDLDERTNVEGVVLPTMQSAFGHLFEYVHGYGTYPGARRYEITTDASEVPQIVVPVVNGLEDSYTAEVFVDGENAGGSEHYGVGFPSHAFEPVLLEPGRPHTIEIRVTDGLLPGATIGYALFDQVG
ncbi:MAG TPA: hypothetical protein VFK52_10615 [Nocardioidaceae bacterium]|nr:hypothetical protein [Nocardioidaceae bacterium]